MRGGSLSRRLLLLSLAVVAVVWVASSIFAVVRVRHEAGELLDAHLAQAAAMLHARVGDDVDESELSSSTYAELLSEIDRCATGLARLGLKQGDRLLIAMPTCPQGVIAFYAANKLGAVPALIHPLSTTAEIEHYLDASGAEIALALDAFYPQMAAARPRQGLRHIVVARIGDHLSMPRRLGFWLAKGRKIGAVPREPRVRPWRQLMRARHPAAPPAVGGTHGRAAILFSGGTTGLPKAIVLSNRNFIAEGMQPAAWGRISGRGSSRRRHP